ncbi:MAG: hypothetical protein EOO51_07740 [Flavobacterium sp.]|nr:MAG: hypothetical protein EOO51_07740 [Flavobacterium sp.]
MFTLNKISISENGRRVNYDYSVSPQIAKYFNRNEPFYIKYDTDVTAVPESILAVPLLANVMPIAWFAGFDVTVPALDETFSESLENLRNEFKIHFPDIDPDVTLHVENPISNVIEGDGTGLLFSGGLDAFESLTRNLEKHPFLISVHGADIDVDDQDRWENFKRFNAEQPVIGSERICYVECNLRTFYTYEVDLLVNIGWWGKIQHGMALISLIAPLSILKGIKTVLIASSNTGEVSFGWGSTSETDEKVRWADMKVIHDGFHLRRTEKIQNIVDYSNRTGEFIKLRVCYSEMRTGYNCSHCAKCQRTMLGLILCGANPHDFGFDTPQDFYDLLFKNFTPGAVMTTGVAYEWRCLQEKAAAAENFYVLSDAAREKNNIDTFAALDLKAIVSTNISENRPMKRFKYILISKYPRLFNFYLSIRRKI